MAATTLAKVSNFSRKHNQDSVFFWATVIMCTRLYVNVTISTWVSWARKWLKLERNLPARITIQWQLHFHRIMKQIKIKPHPEREGGR
uniref:Uncharacterized protein n=1 Tax=Rhizophora mucronata TaxID=61149 RepID=A0A2P2NK40_RHIMU